jgi:hypothetical protein
MVDDKNEPAGPVDTDLTLDWVQKPARSKGEKRDLAMV